MLRAQEREDQLVDHQVAIESLEHERDNLVLQVQTLKEDNE